MNERMTLEQLKAVSSKQLFNAWMDAVFPFDMADGCRKCMTMHHPSYSGCCTEHLALSRQIGALINFGEPFEELLPRHLEEIYALRLFFDSLYKQDEPAQEAAPAEKAVASCQS